MSYDHTFTHLPDTNILWLTLYELSEYHPSYLPYRNTDVPFSHILEMMDSKSLSIRINAITRINNKELTVEPPFPSAPKFPSRYEIKIQRDGSFCLQTFYSVYAAKKFLDIVLGDDDLNWITDKRATCRDLTIRSRHLKRFVTYDYTDDEREWILPLPYNYYARSIGYGDSYSTAMEALGQHNPQHSPQPQGHAKSRKSRSRKSEPKSPRSSSGDTFGIPELASEANISGSKVRSILRRHATKPQGGWNWPNAQKAEILKIIQGNR